MKISNKFSVTGASFTIIAICVQRLKLLNQRKGTFSLCVTDPSFFFCKNDIQVQWKLNCIYQTIIYVVDCTFVELNKIEFYYFDIQMEQNMKKYFLASKLLCYGYAL